MPQDSRNGCLLGSRHMQDAAVPGKHAQAGCMENWAMPELHIHGMQMLSYCKLPQLSSAHSTMAMSPRDGITSYGEQQDAARSMCC